MKGFRIIFKEKCLTCQSHFKLPQKIPHNLKRNTEIHIILLKQSLKSQWLKTEFKITGSTQPVDLT